MTDLNSLNKNIDELENSLSEFKKAILPYLENKTPSKPKEKLVITPKKNIEIPTRKPGTRKQFCSIQPKDILNSHDSGFKLFKKEVFKDYMVPGVSEEDVNDEIKKEWENMDALMQRTYRTNSEGSMWKNI